MFGLAKKARNVVALLSLAGFLALSIIPFSESLVTLVGFSGSISTIMLGFKN